MQDTRSMTDPDVYKGLRKDPVSGDYRVDSGYGYQANRYKIDESYLDEDDNLWIKADAVEQRAGNNNHNHNGR